MPKCTPEHRSLGEPQLLGRLPFTVLPPALKVLVAILVAKDNGDGSQAEWTQQSLKVRAGTTLSLTLRKPWVDTTTVAKRSCTLPIQACTNQE